MCAGRAQAPPVPAGASAGWDTLLACVFVQTDGSRSPAVGPALATDHGGRDTHPLPALPAGSFPGSLPAGLACMDTSPGSLSAHPVLALLSSVFCSGHLFPWHSDSFLLFNCFLLYQIVAAGGRSLVPFALCCFSTWNLTKHIIGTQQRSVEGRRMRNGPSLEEWTVQCESSSDPSNGS